MLGTIALNNLHLVSQSLIFGIIHMSFMQAVPTSKGQALADEYGIQFFETVSESHNLQPCYM